MQLVVDKYDIKVDLWDKEGHSMLSYTAENGHDAVVQLLVDRSLVDRSNIKADS